MPGDDERALVEQAHQIEQLTRHPGWEVYVSWLEHLAGPHRRRVLNGNYKSLEDYREGVGILKGVTSALTAAADTQKLVTTARENGS